MDAATKQVVREWVMIVSQFARFGSSVWFITWVWGRHPDSWLITKLALSVLAFGVFYSLVFPAVVTGIFMIWKVGEAMFSRDQSPPPPSES